MPPLVVIDMQPHFEKSMPKVEETVIEHIQESKRQHDWIILVRITDCGEISDRIMNAVKEYDKVCVIDKEWNDGSNEILDCIGKQNISGEVLKVCGINTSACVADTVYGLHKHDEIKKIIILSDACACPVDTRHEETIKNFRELQKLEVL